MIPIRMLPIPPVLRFRLVCVVLTVAVLGAALIARQPPGGRGGTPPGPDGECPAGTTEVRPGSCQAPELPAPSIVDYRPRSTLVTRTHLVPKAKFPAIDVHGHPPSLTSADSIAKVVAEMDKLNLRVMVAANSLSGDRLQSVLAAVNGGPHKERFRALTGIDFQNVGPGWAERAVGQLEADINAGAIGVGEVSKSFGLDIRKPDGTRLQIDDPALDPVWEALARLDVPAFIHTAEPPEFFQPLDYRNERWLELALFPSRRNNGPNDPRFETLMTERNNLFKKHPKTRFIAAHFGWHANDLQRAAALLDACPNVYLEVGAVLYDLGRQPRSGHDFFVKYQDRILFGKDSFQPNEYPYFWRVFETRDEYFDYYRDYHAFWKLYGMDLPDAVLKKLYYQNALRIFKGLPRSGWPQ
jgi:predicted TIM-barrel fold metal-dependent hydrolase